MWKIPIRFPRAQSGLCKSLFVQPATQEEQRNSIKIHSKWKKAATPHNVWTKPRKYSKNYLND